MVRVPRRKCMNRISLLAAGLFATVALQPLAAAETETFTVLIAGRNVGHLNATTDAGRTTIDYDVKNNGRGPPLPRR